jgi:TorA maturation chaperone TorD
MEVSVEKLAELKAEAALNSLLAQAMNYPSAELAESLHAGQFAAALRWSLAVLGDASLQSEIDSCAEEYRKKNSAEAILLDLERDYTRMFFSSKPRIAYLFESVYREGKLLPESTIEIAGLYRDAGLTLSEDFRLPPDHIAVELEFFSFLLFKEIEGIEKKDKEVVDYAKELQDLVVNQHIKLFALHLAERVAGHAHTTFYRTVAQILQRYYSNRGV